jgi:hypothetical protein
LVEKGPVVSSAGADRASVTSGAVVVPPLRAVAPNGLESTPNRSTVIGGRAGPKDWTAWRL